MHDMPYAGLSAYDDGKLRRMRSVPYDVGRRRTRQRPSNGSGERPNRIEYADGELGPSQVRRSDDVGLHFERHGRKDGS